MNRVQSWIFQIRQWWGECLHEAVFFYTPPPEDPEEEWVTGPRWLQYVRALWVGLRSMTWPLWHPIARWVCRRVGHNIIDNGSYAGPESGADHMTCSRCGECWSHIYY